MIESPLIAPFPRVSLAHLPTPLQFMRGLSDLCGTSRLFIKRDDCTGLGFGGNKTRKLEFAIGAARAAGADTLITEGSWQSNHVRQTAAAAAHVGMRCQAVLANATGRETDHYAASGNLLLDRLLGAELHFVEDEHQATADDVDRLTREIIAAGGRPFIIPPGASDATGSIGYVQCAHELLLQCEEQRIRPRAICLATGSGGTHAGLLVGLRAHASDIPVIGISVSEAAEVKRGKVRRIADDLLDLLEKRRDIVPDSEIIVHDCYNGGGYGLVDEATLAAIDQVATSEGLLLDPVYTGKAMAGLLDLLKQGSMRGDVIFLHSGGTPALFAYADLFPSRQVSGLCA